MSSKSIFLLAIIMGGITTLLFNNYLKNSISSTAAVVADNTVDIIVAAEPLKKNERITAEKLEVTTIPEKAFHPQTITSKEELEGLFVNADMEQGEAFFTHRVQSEEEETVFISRKVKEGFRAVSIVVNYEQSVSTMVEPDDLVDVFFSKTERKEDENVKVVSRLILENVRVLAVGRKMKEPSSHEDYAEYSTVTFELTPGDAVKLLDARVAVVDEGATIHLMLNSRINEEKENN
ncbi:Flp pilus assembly protein CpaB [Anaerobacillus sp. CMMVII]|uniref:Flp pilus assembly protein CpaB n=1 Tax=Anaerobacillus sp. CMMVII TaxID=2755588 RepID=UPI0021B79517|nr:Flp pilus assembly protein CpaB [Anaerobacillus sp. CMMVII]MCT8136523.1 Flp pilus assembly protein CpaB [Anaerobacillus sp. CMMVII]